MAPIELSVSILVFKDEWNIGDLCAKLFWCLHRSLPSVRPNDRVRSACNFWMPVDTAETLIRLDGARGVVLAGFSAGGAAMQ
jgi:hypothetical protein